MNKYHFKLVDGYDYPTVFVSFTTKSGVRIGGAVLVDTASRHNVLNWSVVCLLDDACIDKDGGIALTSFRGERADAVSVRFGFSIDGDSFEELFYAAKDVCLDSVLENRVTVGIIGVDFLGKYGFSLDLARGALLSQGRTAKGGCLFPLDYGFSKYGFPVVMAASDGMKFGCLVDSGSPLNITTRYALENCSLVHGPLRKGKPFRSITRSVGASRAMVEMELACKGPMLEECSGFRFREPFHIMDDSQNIIAGADGIPPIWVILGSSFLRNHKCVVDFEKKLLYASQNGYLDKCC